MASTGTSNGAQRSASRAQPVQQGWGGGTLINGGRRPTCLQGCWPDVGTAAKEELRVADVRLSRLEHKAQPCAPLPAMPTRGGARHNANYTH
ncbi:hypothetical protein CE143_05690 [Photorhabdus luminescens]|uniref:Uncharacterized protein n=1 Tax=Photorhabdus akhurstii TaxID=171438 RepID=A0ABX8LT36_9GAMM|nr:hypothetical protein [Photorhabdus akhurstii]QXF32714.1 hypothetical protein B0X70_05725 [Photorhabdus akhurstii]QXF32721.1 hypothetical protein B0X70_05765 [Photorhabdus akhurstii]UJD74511.1 hypothetical protein CE143_05650 [Photorhabdus luminescens]UJD74519.1 hypothetical protein CE143_05690 [Photorhabdus luminescens]